MLILSLLIIFINSVNSLTLNKFPFSYIPLYNLTDVDLKNFSDCEQLLKPLRDKCENHYIKALDETKFRHQMDFNKESSRRAIFCDIWRLKTCVAKAAEGIQECGPEVAKRYQIMPNDKAIEDELLGKCSENAENSSIKNFAVKQATNLFVSFIITLIVFLFFET
jgi:hypothetical protein